MLSRSLICAVGIIGLCLASASHAQTKDDPKATGQKAAPAAKASGQAAAPDADEAAGDAGDADAADAADAAEAPSEPANVPAPPPTKNYSLQLKDLANRVNELKERIFRSKARLNLLKETVLHGVIAGSRAIIKHKNEMGSSFRLVKLVYALDGAQIFSKSDETGALNDKREFEVFNGSIVPGNHTISVQMQYRGHGYGIFSYLKGYTFKVRSSHTFTAGEGKNTAVTIFAYEKGNITTELKDRPAIKFKVNIYSIGRQQDKGGGK